MTTGEGLRQNGGTRRSCAQHGPRAASADLRRVCRQQSNKRPALHLSRIGSTRWWSGNARTMPISCADTESGGTYAPTWAAGEN